MNPEWESRFRSPMMFSGSSTIRSPIGSVPPSGSAVLIRVSGLTTDLATATVSTTRIQGAWFLRRKILRGGLHLVVGVSPLQGRKKLDSLQVAHEDAPRASFKIRELLQNVGHGKPGERRGFNV